MKKEDIYHLYYSGMDQFDFEEKWLSENLEYFCGLCHRQKKYDRGLDIVLDRKITGKSDMVFAGHLPVPGIFSNRLCDSLGGDVDKYLHLGSVSSIDEDAGIVDTPYRSFVGRSEYVTLRGKTASLFDGRPFPENERLVVCEECGFRSRRERAPWFLFESEYPEETISCTGLGLLVHRDIYERLKTLKLKEVRMQKVEIL